MAGTELLAERPTHLIEVICRAADEATCQATIFNGGATGAGEAHARTLLV